jgi:hypothetical protein
MNLGVVQQHESSLIFCYPGSEYLEEFLVKKRGKKVVL